MRNIKEANFAWGALNSKLNEIIKVVNQNSPIAGENVHLEEKGEQGVMINATNKGSSAPDSGGGGGGGSATLPALFYFAETQFQSITVMDPRDCSTTSFYVLAWDPNLGNNCTVWGVSTASDGNVALTPHGNGAIP